MTPRAALAPAPRAGRWTRDDILRLGRSGHAWEFLPVALASLRATPKDAELRLAAARALGELGLRTAALEHLALLGDDEEGAALRQVVEALPPDRIVLEELGVVLRTNLDALAERGTDLRPRLAAWRDGASAIDWFRARDGNVVRRRRGGGEAWLVLADHVGAAARFAREHLGPAAAAPGPLLAVEGVDPPWVLLEVARATPRQKDGFQPRLAVVQADPDEFLDGLAQADLSGVLREERTSVYVGADASSRFARDLADRAETQLSGPVIPLNTVRVRADPPVARVLEQARAAQGAEHARLVEQVRAIYAGRDSAWWRRRFESSEPLRVLVPTCRYSTFIRHSSDDLVSALRDAGCEAELLIEPDASSRMSSLAYLRALARLRPDLTILINYPRGALGLTLPPELPLICWVQDAMPHQFDAKVSASQGPLDVLVGHLHRELFDRFGFRRERSLDFPVAVSERKFHAGRIAADLRRRFECELALVSHHSETPESMHARLMREAGPDPLTRRLLEALRPRVLAVAEDPISASPAGRLSRATREAFVESTGREPDDRAHALVLRQYALPLADRVFRHRMLAWAAALAERRGWRLRLYGRGWEDHPALGRYAAGELGHGEELRAAYQAARAHLHASINTVVHQRVMECALSGGLPLSRFTLDDVSPLRNALHARAIGLGLPEVRDEARDRVGYAVADDHELMNFACLLGRLGVPADAVHWAPRVKHERRVRGEVPVLEHARFDLMLGDPGECCFMDAPGLERLAGRAVESDAWRASVIEMIARRVRARHTHAAFVPRLLALVRRAATGELP